jgi:hypothetical protein
MRLSPLNEWTTTPLALHQIARLLGLVGMAARDHLPHYQELALQVEPWGLSTGDLPTGSRVDFHIAHGRVIVQPAQTTEPGETFDFLHRTQARLLEQIAEALENVGGMQADLQRASGATAAERLMDVARSRAAFTLPPIEEYTAMDVLQVDQPSADAYAEALNAAFTGIARFRARLGGHLTPLVVFPEHFDLSTIWFQGEADESKPHISLGFAPFSPGLPRPYLYGYAYPLRAGSPVPTLPDGALWHSAGWTGVVLPHEMIATQEQPAHYIEQVAGDIFRALKSVLGEA